MAHVEEMIRHISTHPGSGGDAASKLRVARLALSGGLLAVALVGIGSQLFGYASLGTIDVVAAILGTVTTAAVALFAAKTRR